MPTTTGKATDFITFSRASNATVTDSDGKIKWAPHNLLLNSESFDASSWTKTTTTVASNSVASPAGPTNAETLTAGGANSTVLQSYTSLGVAYTFGVWLKRKTGTGNIQIAADSGTYTTVTITSDWALYTVSQTPTAGTISAGIRIVTSGDEIYAWGAHLYRSDLGGMQANASAYPMYNPTTPKNLLGFSESLSTGWTNTNSTDAIVSEVNPAGLTGAVDVAATAGNGTLLGSLSLLASPYTFSIWLKRKTGSGNVQITVDGTTYVTVAVTSTWTRFSTTLTPSAGTKTPGIRLATSGDAVYAWGAQLSDSASLDTYSPVYGAAVTSAAYYGPRRDFDPVTLACKGLLVEEQRTNIVLRSQELDSGTWAAPAGVVNVTANSVTAPDGTLTADKLVPAAATNYMIKRQSVAPTAASHTFSVYGKLSDSGYHLELFTTTGSNVGAVFDLSTGAVLGSANCTTTVSSADANGWRRYSITLTANASTTYVDLRVTTASTINQSMTGDGTKGILVWGAQLEAGSFATSYIPTGSASATRNADGASVSTQAFPWNASEGTMVFNGASEGTNDVGLGNYTSSTNYFGFRRIGANSWVASIYLGANAEAGRVYDVDTGWQANSPAKLGIGFKVGQASSLSINGTSPLAGTTTGVSAATYSQLDFIRLAALGRQHIRQVTYLPRRISNTELQTRTA